MKRATTRPTTAPTIATMLGPDGVGAVVDVLVSAGALVGLVVVVVCEDEWVEERRDWKADGMGTVKP